MGERNRELHELMMQIKSGDECAFQRLMNIMTPGLITLGLAYLKNTHDDEDCVQETFITVAAKSTTFNSDKNVCGWIYQIMRRKCLDKLRDAKHTPSCSWNETVRVDLSKYIFEQSEDKILVEVILNQLNREEREVVLLHIWADMPFREISATIHKSLITVERIYKKALENLKNMVQKG